MSYRIANFFVFTLIFITVGGCQLLVDNRSRGSTAVVVVPTEEWDAMRQAQIEINEIKSDFFSADITASAQPPEIEPLPGSEEIRFTNYTGASLGGCATIGILELQHHGNLDDAITLLKNEALRLSSNLLIPTQMHKKEDKNTNVVTIEARMLTCPLKLARGN